ncbi:MAG: hypothetical protein HEEMFOPI_02015 [Holosporales bacterium]
MQIIFFLIFFFSCHLIASSLVDAKKLMGIEVETSSIKTNSWDKRLLIRKKTENFLLLEGDTTDTVLEHTHEKTFNKNIECRSIYGLGKEEIIDAVKQIKVLLKGIHGISLDQPAHITLDAFQTFFLPRIFYTSWITNDDESTLSFISSNAQDVELRPQITLQVELNEIQRVFERLSELGSLSVKFFIEDLSLNTPLPINESNEKIRLLFPKLVRNRDISLSLRNYFREKISTDFKKLQPDGVKGIILLFLHYWYELFNNKEPIGREPGLKQHLRVMSRIPLSDLYDSLNSEEQRAFCDFVESHLPLDDVFKIRDYEDFNGIRVSSKITIKDWYESIKNKKKRKLVSQIDKDGKKIEREVDILSPPGGLPESYSMGYFKINEIPKHFALLECRGYSGLRYKGSKVQLENIEEFVSDETMWFFTKN